MTYHIKLLWGVIKPFINFKTNNGVFRWKFRLYEKYRYFPLSGRRSTFLPQSAQGRETNKQRFTAKKEKVKLLIYLYFEEAGMVYFTHNSITALDYITCFHWFCLTAQSQLNWALGWLIENETMLFVWLLLSSKHPYFK